MCCGDIDTLDFDERLVSELILFVVQKFPVCSQKETKVSADTREDNERSFAGE